MPDSRNWTCIEKPWLRRALAPALACLQGLRTKEDATAFEKKKLSSNQRDLLRPVLSCARGRGCIASVCAVMPGCSFTSNSDMLRQASERCRRGAESCTSGCKAPRAERLGPGGTTARGHLSRGTMGLQMTAATHHRPPLSREKRVPFVRPPRNQRCGCNAVSTVSARA